ncbi:MAG: hypothetical protein LUQ50_09580, partial [Methanospirillum sp.]|uniref:hypothetical protein n=1 Tax=Methanospirillum sp. TaxID=45200 RepID=UPI0023740CD3
MRLLHAFNVLMILSVFVVCTAYAENNTGSEKNTEYVWNGTWSTPDYTVYIMHNQSGITGEYVPTDLIQLDPGRLEGNISDDGKTYSGVWIETGINTYTLSDDMMSFTINGTADPQGPMTEPSIYSGTAKRVGEIVDSANPWTGNWASLNKTYNLTQAGTLLTGTNEPLAGVNDEASNLSGIVSADGITYNGNWIEIGGFTFVMSDNGSSFNATITK